MQNRGGLARLPFRSLRPHWILGRGLCLYRRESFGHVPRPKREAALAFQVPSWSPFDRTGHFAVWSGGEAMVWYWDADSLALEAEHPLLQEAGLDPSQFLVRPETLFRPRRPDGVCLQSCAEGFEIQHWRGGVLQGSYWSLQPPTEQRLAWFADRQGIASAAAPPLLDEWLAEPWSSDLNPREWLLRNELRLVAGLALVLSTLLVWQEARHWKYAWVGEGFAASFAEIQEEVAPFMAARDGHSNLSRVNERLEQLLQEPSQAYLMGLVDGTLADSPATFVEWHYQQGELRVVVEDPSANPVEYVQRLEAQPMFVDVRVGQGRRPGQLELSMKVAS